MNNDNKKGHLYPIFFILLLVVITIMYASLASNFGIKMNNDKYLEPTDNPTTDDNKKDDKSGTNDNTNRRGSNPDTPSKRDNVPVIDPTNINWQIEFENIVVDSSSVTAINDAHILDNKTEINYTVVLSEPGDKYSFDVDITNKGNIDAKIYSTELTGLNSSQLKYIDYKVTYKDGTSIKEGDTLLVGEKKKIHLDIEYITDLNKEDLPNTDQELNLTYKVIYIEK